MIKTRAAAALPPFQWILDEHAPAVLRFLLQRAGPDDAEDCFQETMLAALRAYPALQHGTNLRGWLLTIARNKVIDNARDAQRRPVPSDAVADVAVMDDTNNDDVWDSVRALPAKQRRAVALRFAEDRSYADIAGAMSTTEDAARRNVHEGVKKLRRQMQ